MIHQFNGAGWLIYVSVSWITNDLLEFDLKGLINNKSALFQKMTRRLFGTKPLPEPIPAYDY